MLQSFNPEISEVKTFFFFEGLSGFRLREFHLSMFDNFLEMNFVKKGPTISFAIWNSNREKQCCNFGWWARHVGRLFFFCQRVSGAPTAIATRCPWLLSQRWNRYGEMHPCAFLKKTIPSIQTQKQCTGRGVTWCSLEASEKVKGWKRQRCLQQGWRSYWWTFYPSQVKYGT